MNAQLRLAVAAAGALVSLASVLQAQVGTGTGSFSPAGSIGAGGRGGATIGGGALRGPAVNPNFNPQGSLPAYGRFNPAGSIYPALNLNPEGSAFRPRDAQAVSPPGRPAVPSQPHQVYSETARDYAPAEPASLGS